PSGEPHDFCTEARAVVAPDANRRRRHRAARPAARRDLAPVSPTRQETEAAPRRRGLLRRRLRGQPRLRTLAYQGRPRPGPLPQDSERLVGAAVHRLRNVFTGDAPRLRALARRRRRGTRILLLLRGLPALHGRAEDRLRAPVTALPASARTASVVPPG